MKIHEQTFDSNLLFIYLFFIFLLSIYVHKKIMLRLYFSSWVQCGSKCLIFQAESTKKYRNQFKETEMEMTNEKNEGTY